MEEERREIIPDDEESRKIIPRRKVTLQLIEERSQRKACYKKRREGLIKKMKEITTFCGIDACIIIHSPDETVPTVWPSPDVAKQLIQRFQSIPESERCKRMVDHHSFMQDKVKRMERMLTRLKEINEEKQMSLFIYQVCYEGKPVSDYNLDEAKRLLDYVDEKLKQVRLRMGPSQEQVSDPNNNNISVMSNNMELIPSNNTYGGDVGDKEFVQPNFGDFIGESGLVTLPQNNFRGLISGSDSTMMMPYGNVGGFSGGNDMVMLQPQSNFGGLIDRNASTMLTQSNFRGLIGGSTSTMLPHGNFGGFSGENSSRMLLTQSNFGGLANVASDDFEGFNNGKSDLMGVPHQFNSRGINGEENLGVLHGGSTTEIGGSSNWAPYGIGENGIGIDEHNNENYNGPINNISGFQQFNPNNNSEAAMGEFNANFFGSNSGIN